MKRILLSMTALLCVLTAKADPIDLSKARELAAGYMKQGGTPVLVSKGISANQRRRNAAATTTPPYYVFSRGEGQGFVIVGGDDLLPEIIGYTESGDFDATNMPPALADYLMGFEVALDKYQQYVDEHGEEAAQQLVKQRRSARAKAPRRAATSTINPLMTSAWGQAWPYFDLCPMDGNTRSATGCVATSTSSVIHYWRRDCPRYSVASTDSYETWTKKIPVTGYKAGFPMRWELMKDSYDGTNYGNGSDYYTSVSELVAIVGTAVHMDYAAGSSGAQSNEQPNALNVFNLNGTNVWYSGVNNMETWENMIQDDLAVGRPILYSGYSVDANNNWAGHAFVLDGYRLSDGKYYFDFGWNGGWNGWFALSDANGFNTDQSMTYQIFPKRQNLSATISAPDFQANTNNTVTVNVQNNGTFDYTSAINLFCTTEPFQPTAWGAQQADWTTIPAGGANVPLTFTVNPGAGSVWYLTVVDNTMHIIDRIKVPGDVEEVTTKIQNPSFELHNNNTPTGWTLGAGQFSRDANIDHFRAVGADGNMVLDSWKSGDQGDAISQTVTGLAAGTYKLTAKVATDPGNTITVFAGDKTASTGAHDCGKYYLQEVCIDGITVGNDGTLSIGVQAGSWYKADDFRLYRYVNTPARYLTSVQNAAEGQVFVDVTSTLSGWLSTSSFDRYTNNGFTAGPDWGSYSGSDGALVSYPFFEVWTGSNNRLDNKSVEQTITGLANGTYYIGGSFIATSQGSDGPHVEGVTFYAQDQAVALGTLNGVPEIYALKVEVTDGKLTFGVNTDMTSANWVAIDNLFLYREDTDGTLYKEALANCQQAKENYEASVSGAATAALAQYTWTDAELDTKTAEEVSKAITILNNGAAIAKAGQDATAFVVNADFADTGLNGTAPNGWNMTIRSVEGGGDVWTRSQDGANVFNAWYPTINDLEVTQTVSNLPNGTYRLSVDLGTIFEGDAADMVAFIIGERVGASEQVHTYNSGDRRAFGTYTCATTTQTNSVFFGIRALKHYIQMKNVHLQFISGTAAEQETDASYLRQDYFWGGRDAAYVDYTTANNVNQYGQAVGVRLYPRHKNQILYAATGTQFVSEQNNVVANGQCLNLVLTDGVSLEVPRAFTAIDATYSRTMTNQWGTLILPYAVQTDETVQYYTLKAVDEESMHFTPAASVPANTAAIFRRLNTESGNVTIGGESLPVSTTANAATADDCEGWSLVGSYGLATVDDANAYYIAEDKFWKTDGSITVNPFRAYFTNTASAAAKQLNINIDKGEATGIDSLNARRTTDGEAVYDLQGRRVLRPATGLYIVNGKKVFLK